MAWSRRCSEAEHRQGHLSRSRLDARRTRGPYVAVALAVGLSICIAGGVSAAPAKSVLESAAQAPFEMRPPTEAESNRLRALDRAIAAADAARQWEEVEVLARDVLAIEEGSYGPSHPETARTLTTLSVALSRQDKHAAAEQALRRAVDIQRLRLGERNRELASNYDRLASALAEQAKYKEAEALYRRAIEVKTAVMGPRDLAVGISIHNLAELLGDLGRHQEAEAEHRKASKIFVRAAGPYSLAAANGDYGLAGVLDEQGRFREAENLYRRAVAGFRRALGDQDPEVGQGHAALAGNLLKQGRLAEAEGSSRTAVDVFVAAGEGDGPRAADAYEVLAATLSARQRYADAELLDRRVLAIRQAVLGEQHPQTGMSYGNLSVDLSRQGKLEEALAMSRKSLEISIALFGERSQWAARGYNDVAVGLQALGRTAEVADLKRKALEAMRAQLGDRHPDTALMAFSLAWTLNRSGDHSAAESLLRGALETRRALLGDRHPSTASTYAELAASLGAQGRLPEAFEAAERGAAVSRRRRDDSPRGDRREADFGLPLETLLGVASVLATSGQSTPAGLENRAFEAAQDLHRSAAGEALVQSALRSVSARVGAEAEVRSLQQLTEEAGILDERFMKLLADGDLEGAAAVRKRLEEAEVPMERLERQIRARFPRYAELASPAPLSLDEVRKRLKPGEGLFLVIPAARDLYLFALSTEGFEWRRLAGALPEIDAAVRALRCDADPATCVTPNPIEIGPDRLPPFDRRTAFELYRRLVSPVERALAGVTTLYAVTGGPLSGLPLGLLVTQDPGAAHASSADELASTAWLADRYAMVTLPSVSALRALAVAGQAAGRRPLVGYGDPVLAGYDGPFANPSRGGPRATYFRAGPGGQPPLADPALLKRSLPSLPGTRQELVAMAAALGAPASALRMGPAATEASIKASPEVADARVVMLATHGLLPREVRGLDQPGLVFTPPTTASANDDGILTASEAAQLRLVADWVILSACNTAASDGAQGAESLSGLAKAFIFAGARALLVSHWQVDDQVTGALTVRTLMRKAQEPGRSKAQALQDAMRVVRTGRLPDGRQLPNWEPYWAHPGAWAPFVLVSTEP